jgi:hypothetical protein
MLDALMTIVACAAVALVGWGAFLCMLRGDRRVLVARRRQPRADSGGRRRSDAQPASAVLDLRPARAAAELRKAA